MYEMIHISRATVYSSGFFVTLTYLEKHDRVYGQNNQYLQGQVIIFEQSEGRSALEQDSCSYFIWSLPEHVRRN
jgi:hypothetical protein